MILQKDTKDLFNNNELCNSQLNKWFSNSQEYQEEWDLLWDNTILEESIKAHAEYGGEWAGSGTVDYQEGKLLYLFVRTEKPNHILEIGTAQGISASIMAHALEKNQKGNIMCVEMKMPKFPCASFLSHVETGIIDFYYGDAFDFLEEHKTQIFDLIFLDADHRQDFCYKISEILYKQYFNSTILYHEWSLATIAGKPEIDFISRSEWLGKLYEREAFENVFPSDNYIHEGFIGTCGLGLVKRKDNVK